MGAFGSSAHLLPHEVSGIEGGGSTDRSLIFRPMHGVLGREALCTAAAYAEPDNLRALQFYN
jgi:hypothetical protein